MSKVYLKAELNQSKLINHLKTFLSDPCSDDGLTDIAVGLFRAEQDNWVLPFRYRTFRSRDIGVPRLSGF